MITPEDVMHDALPQSVDDSVVTIEGAAKFQQIGTDAAKNTLLALLEEALVPPAIPIMIVDLNAGVGNFADAFLETRSNFNRPIVYVGFTEDPMALAWLVETKLDLVAQMISKGELKIPGHNPYPENIDALIQERPPRPNMNIRVRAGRHARSAEESDVALSLAKSGGTKVAGPPESRHGVPAFPGQDLRREL